jgi:MFS family permease
LRASRRGRGAVWTEEPAEPEGRGADWTEERGTSDEGRWRLKSAPQAEQEHRTSDEGRRCLPGASQADGMHRARASAVAFFVVLGVADGVWLARIPAIKHGLNLSDGVLGVALLATPAGTVLAAAVAGRLVDRFGSARPMPAAGVAVALLPIAFGLANSMAALMVALLAFGVAAGLLDVAMNAQAVRVERGYRRPLFTSFHACYSVGGLAGALLGGLFAWAGVGPAPTFTAVGAPMAVLAVFASRGLLRGPETHGAAGSGAPGSGAAGSTAAGDRGAADGQPADGQPADGQPADGGAADGGAADGGAADGRCPAGDRAAGPSTEDRAGAATRGRAASALIIALGLLAFCCLLGEGAAGSWSAVYLRDNLGTSAGFAALGYAAFSVMMAVGRLFGDRLVARFGPARVVSACGLVAAVGLGAGLISAAPAGALIGFALFGAGLSCTFPQLLSAAGNMTSFPSGRGIARVAGSGYLGFLCGPVLIGGCASLAGLRLAFGVPVILMLVVALGGAAARPAGGPARAGRPAAAGNVMEDREAEAGRPARRRPR